MPRLVKHFAFEYALGVPAEIFLLKIRTDMPAQEEVEAMQMGCGAIVPTAPACTTRAPLEHILILSGDHPPELR